MVQPRVCSTRLSGFISCRLLELDALVHVAVSRKEVNRFGRVRVTGRSEVLVAVELPSRLAHKMSLAHLLFVPAETVPRGAQRTSTCIPAN